MIQPRFTCLVCAGLCAIWLGGWEALQADPSNTPATPAPPATRTNAPANVMNLFQKPTPNELRNKLSPVQFYVTQQAGTEPAFGNTYWDNHQPGLYVDIVSGEPLFSSLDKFDSGCGWPSFTRPLPGVPIVQRPDNSAGMQRIEVRSPLADSHLGHVFNDGPAPTHLRYCINSASLQFIPLEKLEERGYGACLKRFAQAGIHPPKPAPATTNSPAKP